MSIYEAIRNQYRISSMNAEDRDHERESNSCLFRRTGHNGFIPWLKENYDYEVICVCIDVGQGNELDGLEERAKYCGASKLYIEHATDEFCDEYIAPCLMANATYENNYLLGTAMARPLMAKILVDIAKKEGAVAICHGATGKGNDQVRFELGIKALARI